MDATKKKIKKGFAVPASKPSTEDYNEKSKPKKTLGLNRNNSKVEEKKVMGALEETNKEKPKKEEKKSPTEAKTVKPKSVEAKPKAQQSEKKKEKATKKAGEEEKKVQRSLSAEEYDELFMNVLASVMKAEREGDIDDEEEGAPVKDGEEEEKGGEVKEAEDEERVEESDEDAMSEVIQVTVKVESVDGSEHFAHVDPEHEIDNWDGAEKLPGAAAARVISPVRKEIVKTFTSKQDKKSSLYKKQKQEKKPETLKVKEKQAAKSELKPKKKTIVVSNGDKDKKGEIVKKRKREGKPEAGRTEKAVKTRDKRDNISLKKVMQERELEDLGTWVQCGNADCLKWRYLRTITDPMDIPQRWECSMNDDEKFNSCEKAEEDYDEDEHIYTKYTEGSIVLAKMAGYPWWPGMIEIDPDYDSYFEVAVPASMYPTKYHVVFFDKSVSRAWISLSGIKPFNEIEALPRKAKGHDYSKEVNAAVKNAKEALELPIKDRLKKFSFAIRFSGKWGKVGEQNVKAKKHKKRGSKRRKLEEEEVMVDDKTLDQILNNSQSVLSDVAEMLSSIEAATFDSDSDPEFDIEAPKQRKRKTPAVKSEIECPTLNAMAFEEEEDEEEEEEAPVKFEPGQLDGDIFTMEMDAGPVETSHLEQTVNDLDLSKAVDESADAKNNITDSDDAENMDTHGEAVTKGKGESGKNNEDEAKVETSKSKKKKTTNDDKTVEKEDKVEKKLKKSKKNNEHQMNSEENNNLVEKKTKKKSKKTDKNEDICSKEKDESPEKSNDKEVVEKKKKKSKKVDNHGSEQTDENAEQINEKDETQEKKKKKKKSKKNLDDEKVSEEKDKDVEKQEGNEVVQKKKNKPKNNSDENEVSNKKKKIKKKDDTTDMKKVESKSESEGKKKEMVSKEKSNEDEEQNSKDSKEPLEKTIDDENNTENTKDDDNNTENTKEEKKTKPIKVKKPKSKFSNPVVKTTTKEDKCSQGEKNSQQEHPKEAEDNTKKPDSQVKSNTHPESDEELDFDIPTIPVDGAESDEDFLLDLMEPAQSKVQPTAQASANEGDDSEPLDFEE